MSEYRRMRVPGGTYFLGLNLYDRRRTLLIDQVDDLRKAFREVKDERPFHIDAIVILPDHLHCLLTLAPGEIDYSIRLRQIKIKFTRMVPNTERVSNSRKSKRERGIWQRRFWEHTIRDEDDYARHVDYIHYNPVKHGYVKSPIDWPHSSIHRFVEQGILPASWSASREIQNLELECGKGLE